MNERVFEFQTRLHLCMIFRSSPNVAILILVVTNY